MMRRRATSGRGRRPASKDYRRIFIVRVHQLLQMGYARSDAARFRSCKEPEITGELVQAMDNVIDDARSPRWVRQFNVHEERPINVAERLGMARKRLDISVVSSEHWPRNRFAFEAKRLDQSFPVSRYLGADGLECFIAGHYAADDDLGGMLGYVQSGSMMNWASTIEQEVGIDAKRLRVINGGEWSHHPFDRGPSLTYRTRHSRSSSMSEVEIYHSLLKCY